MNRFRVNQYSIKFNYRQLSNHECRNERFSLENQRNTDILESGQSQATDASESTESLNWSEPVSLRLGKAATGIVYSQGNEFARGTNHSD